MHCSRIHPLAAALDAQNLQKTTAQPATHHPMCCAAAAATQPSHLVEACPVMLRAVRCAFQAAMSGGGPSARPCRWRCTAADSAGHSSCARAGRSGASCSDQHSLQRGAQQERWREASCNVAHQRQLD